MSKTALVLSGGGAKGAFAVGVAEVLLSRKPFDVVCGTSVGAINAWVIAKDQMTFLKEFWARIGSKSDVFVPNWLSFFRACMGSGNYPSLYTLDKIAAVMRSLRDLPFKRDLVVGATELESGNYVQVDQSHPQIEDFVLASASIPVIFPRKLINGKHYVDGGLTNNTPLLSAIKAGADEIHVVVCNEAANQIANYDSLVGVLNRSYTIMADHLLMNDVRICRQRNTQSGYRTIRLHVYRPPAPICGLLDFTKGKIAEAIAAGKAVATEALS